MVKITFFNKDKNGDEPAEKYTEVDTSREFDEDSYDHLNDQTIQDVAKISKKSMDEIEKRIEELEDEVDSDKALMITSASLMLGSTVLGLTLSKKWFLITGITAGCLLNHLLSDNKRTNMFNRMGLRSPNEVTEEKQVLKYLRGDFDSYTR